MPELGDTTDPRALVPGNPETVRGEIALCNRYAAGLGRAGDALKLLDTTDWKGQAAEAFRDAFDGHPIDWLNAADAFRDHADALTGYVEILEWAQGQAAEAIALWGEADAATTQARIDHDNAVGREQHRAATTGTPAAPIPFTDPGAEKRAAAQDLLDRAREQLAATGDRTRTTVLDLAAGAPQKPGAWGQAGELLSDVGSGIGDWFTDIGDILGNLDQIPATLAAAATNPTAFAKQLVSWDQFHTNPARWAGHVLPDAALTLAGGAGAIKKGGTLLKGVTATGRADRILAKATHNGKGITDHVANKGADIGPPGKGRKIPTVAVADNAAIQKIFDELSRGGRVIENPGYGGGKGTMVEMPDGSRIGLRGESKTSPDMTIDLRDPDGNKLKLHTETWK
ncbi:putative T7SS-secreted protein [Saccharopolyspora sp. MS10]|uniref:putative T7SS-secreted protein n=1 Tax=Saccharopolyspora sp. MS10 TaxID=3385973 RepID=UPI0039A1AB3D